MHLRFLSLALLLGLPSILGGCGDSAEPADATGADVGPADTLSIEVAALSDGGLTACIPDRHTETVAFGHLDASLRLRDVVTRATCPVAVGAQGVTWEILRSRSDGHVTELTKTAASGDVAWSVHVDRALGIWGFAVDDAAEIAFVLENATADVIAFAGQPFAPGSHAVKLDADGALLWAVELPGEPDLALAPDGRLAVLSQAGDGAEVGGIAVAGLFEATISADGEVTAATPIEVQGETIDVSLVADASGFAVAVDELNGREPVRVQRWSWDGELAWSQTIEGRLAGVTTDRVGTVTLAIFGADLLPAGADPTDLLVVSFTASGETSLSADVGDGRTLFHASGEFPATGPYPLSLAAFPDGRVVVPFFSGAEASSSPSFEDFTFQVAR